MRIGSFHPALTDLDSSPQTTLGGILEADNKTYKYVKFNGTTAISAGDMLCYSSADAALQTVDKALTNFCAGVAVRAVGTSASAQYGFIQIKGVVTMSGTIGGTAPFGTPLTSTGTNAAAGDFGLVYAAAQQVAGYVVQNSTAGRIVDLDCPY